MALAAGSLAGLAVLGACSDAAVSKVAGPTIPEPRFGQLGALAHAVTVCIDPFSSQGTYVFSVGPKASDAANSVYPMFEPIGGIDAVMPGIPQNTVGPWVGDKILGSTSLAAGTVTLGTAGSGFPLCAVVFQRAETEPPPQDPPLLPFFSHPGNRLWHLNAVPGPGQVVNPYGSVNITPPSGPTYTVTCVNDDPALPQATVGQANNVCLDNGGTIYSSANVFHGSSVTYTMTKLETPCPAGLFTSEIADGSADESRWPAGDVGDLLIRYDQFPAPNDNSYGVNAVGWAGGHTFGNLTGSDKAGVQLRNGSTVVLSFTMDYLSSTTRTATTPSGYASLGVTGGDGDMVTGTAAGISVTTSLANNLNKTGYCAAPPAAVDCTVAGTNLLVNSPPTTSNTSYDLANPGAHGLWDFHNTYYARISVDKLTSMGFDFNTWVVEKNLTALHNSPDKPCPPGPFSCADITIGNKTFGSKEVKVDVNNINNTIDAFVTGVHITWPAGNGALKSVKVGGDVIWSGTINGTSADLLLADLVADAGKRKIAKHSDEDIKFTFANNVTQTLGLYTASLDFGDTCNMPILP